MNKTILNKEEEAETLGLFEDEFGKEAVEELEEEKPSYNRFPDVEEDENETELTISKEKINFDLFTKNSLETSHLVLYDEMNNDLGLDGENYEPFKKGLWYYEHSLMQPTISYKISLKTKIDNRFHLLGVSSPSGGKTTTKNQIKRICNSEDLIEVSGLSHPEQLVGKMKTKGRGSEKTTYPVYGILHYKVVLYDEAQDLINEKNDIYAKSQRLKRIAMDCYGDNIISKKLVDDEPKNLLQYESPSRIFDFVHPVKLESPFFDTGSFRRYTAFNLTHDTIIDLTNITKFRMDEKTKVRSYPDLINDYYSKERVDVTFTQKTLDIIGHYHKCLLYYLLKHKNPNAFRYGLLNRYSLRNVFSKNVLILAISKNEKTPSLNTTINSCVDTLLFVFKTIECINDLGDMSISSDVWGGLNEQDAQALEFLWRKKSTSRDNTIISIKKFWTILGHLYGCRITQARSHFYRLKKGGFVDSKQEGMYDSKVWLKFIPKEIKLLEKDFDGLKYWFDNFKGVGGENTLLAPLKAIFTHKNYKKAEDDGGVGVMGCVLIKKVLVIQNPSKNKNKINIYKGGVVTPTPPTPLNKIKDLCVKSKIKGAKTPKTPPTPSVLIKSKKIKSDREVQFYDAKECKDIKPNHTKKEVLEWIKNNPKYKHTELYDKFGIGSYKFEAELKKEKLIK